MKHFKLSDMVQVVHLPVQLISLLTIGLKAPLRDRKGETILFVFFFSCLGMYVKIHGVGQVLNICHEFISEKILVASSFTVPRKGNKCFGYFSPSSFKFYPM